MRPLRSLGIALLAAPVAADPAFEPIAIPDHVYNGGWEHFVGGGLAVFDCDDDGLPELLAAGGENPATLLRNRSTTEALSFEADTPDLLTDPGLIGAYPLDIDNDGWLDLVLLRVGPNQLLKGGPGCSFAPMTDIGFESGNRWTTAFSATWDPSQKLPVLAFGNYVDRTDPDGPFEACDINLLYRPDGDHYGAPLKLQSGYCSLSMLFSDWNRSGRADLRISNDRHYYVTDGQEQMWAMETPPRLLGPADGWVDHKLWGMGIASRDLNRDGYQDVMLSSMGDQRLQRATGVGASFSDVPYDLGTTAHRPYQGDDGRPSTGWHVAFGDVQNDGLDDIFIAKGNVEQMPDAAMKDPNNLLVQQEDGTFREYGGIAGLASMHRGRGAAMVDLNRDGLLDVAVVNRRAPMEVWQNVTKDSQSWLGLKLLQTGSNRNAIGAWIEIRANTRDSHSDSQDEDAPAWQTRELTVGGGHAGGHSGFEHFGVGQAGEVSIRVTWPDGERSSLVHVMPNQYVTLTRTDQGLEVHR